MSLMSKVMHAVKFIFDHLAKTAMTSMLLADAFIQSDMHSVLSVPAIEPMTFALLASYFTVWGIGVINNNNNNNNVCVWLVNVVFMHLSNSQYSYSAYGSRFFTFSYSWWHYCISVFVFVDTSRVDLPFDIHCVKLDIYYILLYPHMYSRVT